MTQLTTLTRDQVRAVLHGLAALGARADDARAVALSAMTEALTTTRPVDPELERLRNELGIIGSLQPLGTLDDLAAEDAALITGILKVITTQADAQERWRDQLSALLDLDPWASDEEITEAAAARAAQRAQERAATKTQALIAVDELQQALAVLETRRARDDVERQALQVVRQAIDEVDQRLASAGERIEAVRQLHRRVQLENAAGIPGYYCSVCRDVQAPERSANWPCPTISALDAP